MSQSGVHQSATCQKGVKSCQKGVLLKRRTDGGVYPRASIPKRGTWSPPTFDHSRSPAIHSRKKNNSGRLGGSQGARQTLQIFIWSQFHGEHGRRGSISRRTWTSPSAKSSVPLFVKVSGGCAPFCQCSIEYVVQQ